MTSEEVWKMASGRDQKGLNGSRNHHKSLKGGGGNSTGSKGYGSSGQTRQPKYTVGDAIMGKKPPKKSGVSRSSFGGNTSGRKKPYKSF